MHRQYCAYVYVHLSKVMMLPGPVAYITDIQNNDLSFNQDSF